MNTIPPGEPSGKPLSASIVTHNSADEVIELLQSMRDQLDLSQVAVYVVDNASSDETLARVAQAYPWVILLENDRNVGFGAAHNQVLGLLNSKYHAVINPDVVFLEDSLARLAAYLDEHAEGVMVAPRIYNRDGTEQHLPKRLPKPINLLARRVAPRSVFAQRIDRAYTRAEEQFTAPTPVEHASGAFFLIRTEAFRKLGGFDERFFLYFEDNDLSLRASRLGQIVFYPSTAVVHGYARASKGGRREFLHLLRSAFRYFRKHGWS